MELHNVSNHELVTYIINSNDINDRNKAMEQLLKQKPDNYDLRRLVQFTGFKQQAGELLLKQNPDNNDLCLLIQYKEFKQQAGEVLLTQNPDNDDLCLLIQYTDFKEQAWELLLKQNCGNYDLHWLIQYTDFKQEAWEQLLKQNPTNQELCNLIEQTEYKQQAAIELRKKFGITDPIDEDALMKQIAEMILITPKNILMDTLNWGVSFCMGEFARTINEHAHKIWDEDSADLAAYALLPKYSTLFDKTYDEFLKGLKEIA